MTCIEISDELFFPCKGSSIVYCIYCIVICCLFSVVLTSYLISHYKHELCSVGHGCGVATIYTNILNDNQSIGWRFKSFGTLVLNVPLPDIRKKTLLSLVLAPVYKPIGLS